MTCMPSDVGKNNGLRFLRPGPNRVHWRYIAEKTWTPNVFRNNEVAHSAEAPLLISPTQRPLFFDFTQLFHTGVFMSPHHRISIYVLSACLSIGVGCSEKSSLSKPVEGAAPEQDWTTLKDFDAISLAGPDNVHINFAASFSVRVEAEDTVRKELRVERKGTNLRIYRELGIAQRPANPPATIHISLPKLTEIGLAGSGSAHIDQIDTESLEVQIAGSGDVNIGAGKMQSLELSVAGSGTFQAAKVEVQKGQVNVAGSGNAFFSSNGVVQGNILGSGELHIKGNATCEPTILGSGKMTCES